MKLTDRRTDSSSSTRWTVRPPSAIVLSRSIAQGEMKRRAAEQAGRLRPDPAAMAGDDRMADGKANAHSVRLGAEEGLEQPIGHLRRQARAAVLDGDLHLLPVELPGADPETADRSAGHRLDRVANEVEDHLLDLDAVDDDAVDGRIEPDLDLDAPIAGADQRQRARLVDDPFEAFHALVGFSTRDEIPEPSDDL